MYHAFYSLKQEQYLNSDGLTANYYLDENGKEVRITQVGKSPVSESKWDDTKYLGTVVKRSRSAQPIIDSLEFERAKRERIRREEVMSLKNW